MLGCNLLGLKVRLQSRRIQRQVIDLKFIRYQNHTFKGTGRVESSEKIPLPSLPNALPLLPS